MRVTGYIYRADIYCPACIISALPTGAGQAFDGWEDVSVPPMSAEENLTELAAAFGINRMDETTFDSDEFPKVIFSTDDDGEQCGSCGDALS